MTREYFSRISETARTALAGTGSERAVVGEDKYGMGGRTNLDSATSSPPEEKPAPKIGALGIPPRLFKPNFYFFHVSQQARLQDFGE